MKIPSVVAFLAMLSFGQAQAGFIVDVYDSSTSITSMTAAESLFGGTPDHSGMFNTINFSDSGNGDASNTHFLGDVAFPGGVQTDFALQATGLFSIAADGWYTLGVRHDDGAALSINGAEVLRWEGVTNDRDTLGSIHLSAGLHSLDLGFFEHLGGAHLELFIAKGQVSSFSTGAFSLLEAAKVPAPGTLLLLGSGILMLSFRKYKRQA